MCNCSDEVVPAAVPAAVHVGKTEEKNMAIHRNAKPGEQVRYTGANIGYMPGVPMKDMDAEEWNALDGDLRENALRAGLYQLGGPEEGAEQTAEIKGDMANPVTSEPPAEPPAQEPTKSAKRPRAAHEEQREN